ncbi:DUF924 family protein [Solirhodobacter olei]|uniref:DUF924 family protein n=1 Tax=Solirhodobacter olei TaxID=2493082 RepID=UPI000FDA678D|nr:DUF924 family protein [Solirhodobacter olei]
MSDPEEILAFWLDELGPERWYAGGKALDAEIRERFEETWRAAAAGRLESWLSGPRSALAYLILTDQFPRNMFRGESDAFATDARARAAAAKALEEGWDLEVAEPARQFFYMPFMHSEDLSHQDRCVGLMAERMPETGDHNHLHARAHREVIRRFGRFPHRNGALDRDTTEEEASFLDDGGYGAIVKHLGG